MDDAAGIEAGYPSAFGMGNLQWAYFHNMLREWLDGRGEILSLSCQFRSPNLKGQTVSARGKVTGIEADGDGSTVSLDVWTENQDGEVMAPAKAVVALTSQA